MESVNGDWEELRLEFCYLFSLLNRTNSLSFEILNFEQIEKGSIGAAWARFLCLLASHPDFSIHDDVSLYIFCSCLDMDAALDLDITTRRLFAHKTLTEGRKFLDSLLENSSSRTKPRRKESKSKPLPSTSKDLFVEPSPEPRTSKQEEIQPSEFTFQFKDDPFENLRNTLNHLCRRNLLLSISLNPEIP
jgi:hypothetical protein